MSAFNVADTKSDAKSAAAAPLEFTTFDEMNAALNVIGGVDVGVSIKKEAGVSVNITRTDEDDAVPQDDDASGPKIPVINTSYWSAFYRAGDIKYDSPLKAALTVFEKVKNRVWRNKKTGQMVHDQPSLLGVHIGTLVDSKVQTGGFTWKNMHVRDARVHLPWDRRSSAYELLSWMNVTVPLNESKGTTCTDGSNQAFRKRVAAAGTKEFVANLMCSTVQSVAVYAPSSRGPKGESACLAICFDFHAVVTSHYLNDQVVLGLLQHGLLVWDISVKADDGSVQFVTVCGMAGLLEIMALSNVRATYGLNQSTDTVDKEEGTGKLRGKKLLYYKKDNLTGGMFGILHNYLMQGILAREASPMSAASAAAAEVDDNRVAEAERVIADLNLRLSQAENGRRVANEGLALQTSRATALASEVDRLKKDAMRLVGAIKTKEARDAKIVEHGKNTVAINDQQFRAGVLAALTPRAPSVPALERPPAAAATAAAAAAATPVRPVSAAAARPALGAATPRVASNQPAGYPQNGMSDSS